MSFRPKDLYGWRLFRHMKAMAQHSEQFVPPPWFTAMEKVPPSNPGPLIGMKKGKITFPDDELRRKIEKRSEVAKQMAKHGFAPLPWWFTRRPFDDAVVEIKKLKREYPDKTIDEVIDMWDEKMRRHIAVRKREQQLQSEEALKRSRSAAGASGQVTGGADNVEQVITVADSIKIMRVLHNAQRESKVKQEQRIAVSLRKAVRPEQLLYASDPKFLKYDTTPTFSVTTGRVKQNGLSERAKAILRDAITTDERGNPIMKPLPPRIETDREGEEEQGSGDAGIEFAETTETDAESLNRLEIEKRLNPTVLRKIAQARQVQRMVVGAMNLRRHMSDVKATFSVNDEMTPFDFLLTYIKAYNINRVSPTSAEWTQEKATFLNDPHGRELEEMMTDVQEQFIMEFNRFMLLDETQIDVGRVLNNLSSDLGFPEDNNPFARPEDELKSEIIEPSSQQWRHSFNPKLATTNPVLLELGVTPPDFTGLISSFEKYGWTGFNKMKMRQSKMEELFFLLEVDQFLRDGVVKQYAPLKSVAFDPEERTQRDAMSFMRTTQKFVEVDPVEMIESEVSDTFADTEEEGMTAEEDDMAGILDHVAGVPVEFDSLTEGPVRDFVPPEGTDITSLMEEEEEGRMGIYEFVQEGEEGDDEYEEGEEEEEELALDEDLSRDPRLVAAAKLLKEHS